jgi:hypothetical protein
MDLRRGMQRLRSFPVICKTLPGSECQGSHPVPWRRSALCHIFCCNNIFVSVVLRQNFLAPKFRNYRGSKKRLFSFVFSLRLVSNNKPYSFCLQIKVPAPYCLQCYLISSATPFFCKTTNKSFFLLCHFVVQCGANC